MIVINRTPLVHSVRYLLSNQNFVNDEITVTIKFMKFGPRKKDLYECAYGWYNGDPPRIMIHVDPEFSYPLLYHRMGMEEWFHYPDDAAVCLFGHELWHHYVFVGLGDGSLKACCMESCEKKQSMWDTGDYKQCSKHCEFLACSAGFKWLRDYKKWAVNTV